MIVRSAGLHLAAFAAVLAALDAGAYAFMHRYYASLLEPVAGTSAYARAMGVAMQHVIVTLGWIDLPLLAIFALASYALARAAIAPLVAARERERVFAADAAHELRTPLAAIASLAQAAQHGSEAQVRDALTEIAQSALDAAATIDDLLTLARAPRPQALACEPVDLAAVVARSLREFAARAAGGGIAIDCDTDSAIVDGEERRLRELTRNLLDNALKNAARQIRVCTRVDATAATLSVEDDGPGVAPEERERIFERFYRRDGRGTGLGLAIVRWVARAHGASVTAGASPLGGAAFVVRFSRADQSRDNRGAE